MATILVADDDSSNRLLLATLLEAHDHVVLEAKNGDEALAVVRELRPELLIVDLNMPGMNGVELIRRLRDDDVTASVKIVIYTASVAGASLGQFLKASGVDGVLPKPSEPTEALCIIEGVLGSSI